MNFINKMHLIANKNPNIEIARDQRSIEVHRVPLKMCKQNSKK